MYFTRSFNNVIISWLSENVVDCFTVDFDNKLLSITSLYIWIVVLGPNEVSSEASLNHLFYSLKMTYQRFPICSYLPSKSVIKQLKIETPPSTLIPFLTPRKESNFSSNLFKKKFGPKIVILTVFISEYILS